MFEFISFVVGALNELQNFEFGRLEVLILELRFWPYINFIGR
jgi:hypothetical protein